MMKKTLYLFSSGMLRRKDNSILFQTDERKRVLPVEDINDIYIFGEIDVTKKFLEFMTQKKICIHYFNHYGYYVGTFYPREHLNSGHVILKQAEHYIDPTKRVNLAQTFVKGSIAQMIQVLKYYQNRKQEYKEMFQTTIEELQEYLARQEKWKSVEEMMADEGNAKELYYKMFDFILGENPHFPFEKRTRRPPLNRLNAMISFGNQLCYTLVLSEIYKTYLDPRIGFLHSTNFRRFSLNLDVAEVFKPIIVDRLIFTLINKRIITKDDFEKDLGGILLSENGRKKFVTEMDKRLKTTVKHRQLGRTVSYQRLVRLELYKIQKHLLGEKEYVPYVSSW